MKTQIKNRLLVVLGILVMTISASSQSNNTNVKDGTIKKMSSYELYQKGCIDAIRYYKGKGLIAGSAVLYLQPEIGFPAKIAMVAVVPVNMYKQKVSSADYLNYDPYVKGYQETARKKKLNKVIEGTVIEWSAILIGTLTYLCISMPMN